MKIVIVGGHGKIALHLTALLTQAGHQVVGVVRNPDHEADIVARGGRAHVLDIETASVHDLVKVISGADAVVFAAGAGSGSGAERKWTVDRDGALLTADAAEIAKVRRLLVVSAMHVDDADQTSTDVFQVYLRAKAEADASVRNRDLEWTIIRPGGLTDEPATGMVELGVDLERGSISRADVAQILNKAITDRLVARMQFSAVAGSTPIAQALRDVSDAHTD